MSDYIVEGKYKYGIEKSVNSSFLSFENKCFATNLNKTIEPQSYYEDAMDPNWVSEMEALHQNQT